MVTYIALLSYTDQGIRNVKQTVDRARAFKASAERFKATVKELYWTQGVYDLVAVLEVPDEKTGIALLLTLGSLGNIRSQTLRAYSSDDMKDIIAKMG